ncbi:MoaD/ThiS family protein [Arthrobacter crystallopoietes]|uniref:MoaD/ThiS family protein n=1 Tax=Crystallibacter crystallopoietes TaxID=37928 RepID=UPI001F0F793A|nr:MoaD/ThiS family protein [Arthrobacter crystallopoietes]
MTNTDPKVTSVTLYYFAAASEAMGRSEETVAVPSGASLAAVIDTITETRPEACRVLNICALLVDGVASRDRSVPLPNANSLRVDVLPPFAGG